MAWTTNKTAKAGVLAILLMLTSCRISFTMNGASIDYNKTKTIQIADFPHTGKLRLGTDAGNIQQ